MTPHALIIPLGTAADDAISLLAADGLVDRSRCLTGFPHPSGGNGHRVRIYQANREMLSYKVAKWAATRTSWRERVSPAAVASGPADIQLEVADFGMKQGTRKHAIASSIGTGSRPAAGSGRRTSVASGPYPSSLPR